MSPPINACMRNRCTIWFTVWIAQGWLLNETFLVQFMMYTELKTVVIVVIAVASTFLIHPTNFMRLHLPG